MSLGRSANRVLLRLVVGAVCFAAILTGSAIGQSAIPNAAVAGGGGTVSAGQFTLHYTIGEPTAGPTSASGVTLTSGFQATFLQPSGDDGGNCSIFCDGFEGGS